MEERDADVVTRDRVIGRAPRRPPHHRITTAWVMRPGAPLRSVDTRVEPAADITARAMRTPRAAAVAGLAELVFPCWVSLLSVHLLVVACDRDRGGIAGAPS